MAKGQKGRAVRPAAEALKNPVLLWIGDSGCYTGFAEVTRNVLIGLKKNWDVHALAVNYFGDPHTEQFPLYPAGMRGDVYGVNRLEELIVQLKPAVIIILNDPWIVRDYIPILEKYPNIVRLCYTPIDSPNVMAEFALPLNKLDGVISYTEFGAKELIKSGTTVPMFVAPHGVDTKVFAPLDRTKTRKQLTIPEDWFVVGLVGRNQFRKKIDLAMQIFKRFAVDKPDTVKFFYHGNTRDVGWRIEDMAGYFGIADRLMLTSTTNKIVTQKTLNDIYNSFDVHISTALGEGWGLCNMEAASAGVPQIVPKWSALEEWLTAGAIQVPILIEEMNTGGINTSGGFVDFNLFVDALNDVYYNREKLVTLGKEARALTTQQKYRWPVIADQFDSIIREVARVKFTTDKQS